MGSPAGSRLLFGIAGALAGAAAVGLIWFLTTRHGEPEGPGTVQVSYERGSPEAARLIRRSGVFEKVADTVNSELALPEDLTVRVVGPADAAAAGVAGPTYVPEDHTVYFPWAFVSRSHDDLVAPTRETAGLGHARIDGVLKRAMAFVLYHEIAHGIFDELGVPLLAGEERTADSLAIVLSLAADRRGPALPLSVALLDLAGADRSARPSVADFADDHGFDRQRAFDALCAVYGSAPGAHADLLRGPYALPPTRAELCRFDYERAVRDWRRVLAPNLTHRGGLLPLGE